MWLERMTWPDVKQLDLGRLVVLCPLGALEQHGHHLPLSTDTDIVTAIAQGVEAARPAQLLGLPTLWTGHSTHHLSFPGTISVRQMHYIDLVVDVCRSIVDMGGRKIFFLNGHGGNDVPLRAALREIKTDAGAVPDLHVVSASYWQLAAATIARHRESGVGGVSHACEMETSIMLHLRPDRVRMELARRDGPTHPSPYRKADMQLAKPVYYVNEFHEISETGTVGHPDLASRDKGQSFLDGIVHEVGTFVDDFLTW
ncbi:MAG: creatininase family protein [Acidobacteria bacterium]|nr:creatininase family protein [Acidobacteriota bacterium]